MERPPQDGRRAVAGAAGTPPDRPPPDRRPTDPAVVRDGHEHEFFQALRLLRGLTGGRPVRVRPDPRTVFPPSDVSRVERTPDGATVTVSFGGLYGVDAALPAALVAGVPLDPLGTRPLQDFLDMFSGRFYEALYEAWARYRPEVTPGAEGGADLHARRALALAGLGTPEAPLPVSADRLVPFAGRLGGWSRPAEGLQVLVEHVLGVPVEVVENVPRWVRMDDRPALGAARLGVDAVVGERVRDASGQFRLVVGPLGLGRFLALLPGGEGARALSGLVRLAAPDGLAYDVELRLTAAEVPPLRLGEAASAQVGRTACLGRPGAGDVARLVRYDE